MKITVGSRKITPICRTERLNFWLAHVRANALENKSETGFRGSQTCSFSHKISENGDMQTGCASLHMNLHATHALLCIFSGGLCIWDR
jgi:hypothetical protein